MSNPKDDDSTDIEDVVQTFAKDMAAACTELRKSRILKQKKDAETSKSKPPSEPSIITFFLDSNPATQSRTPAEQAEQVAAGRSAVCWSGHMTDKARHVIMKADGKTIFDPKKALGPDYEAFKKLWGEAMKENGLKNFRSQDGWADGDAFHLELSEAKIKKTDERAKACLEEYAKLTRKTGKKKNDSFEKKYSKELKSYIDKYEKEAKGK